MAEWHTISAKFTSEEKRVLDILRDSYGLSYNQSLRKSLEIFARIFTMCEYYVSADSKILKKITKIGNKSMKQMDSEIITMLKEIPTEIQESEYEKFSQDRTKIFSYFGKIFVERKPGRPPKKRSPGRPKDNGYSKS